MSDPHSQGKLILTILLIDIWARPMDKILLLQHTKKKDKLTT